MTDYDEPDLSGMGLTELLLTAALCEAVLAVLTVGAAWRAVLSVGGRVLR